ncbi:hypothetical protein [Vibrio sinaloensis]|uniref:hypothetical protein n=1 Tax=Photobacterium sp. (strain ATCC 43367) TaxID=379097 RepID=UPI00205DB2E2|nr:hypothetical protein [Vibrio sinaloensis]UPQ90264.1 hypothetical protein MTO69_16050 [Vibrio sinaloensis]
MKWMIAGLLCLVTLVSYASNEEPLPRSAPFLNVEMTLELDGIERAMDDTRVSLDNIALALEEIADSEELTPDQQALMDDTTENINQLVILSKQSLQGLPQAFDETKQVLATSSERFLADVRQQVILTLSLIGFIIVAIIAAIAWFILRPMQQTLSTATANLASMASAIKTTAQALQAVSAHQQQLADQLDSLQSDVDPKSKNKE